MRPPQEPGPVAVVPLAEVGAEAVELGESREEPEAGEDRLLEGAEDPFDATVHPRVGGAGEDVADAACGEERRHRLCAKGGTTVSEESIRSAVPLHGGVEGACDLGTGRPPQALEGDDSAAAVVDDAEDPDGEEAEDEDEGEVGAPELAGPADADLPRPSAPRLLEGGDEIPAADDDLAEGLAGSVEPEDAAGEKSKLPGTEEQLLDVEADDVLFDVLGGAVPGDAVALPRRRGRKAMALEPGRVDPPERPAPPLDLARKPLAVVVDGEGEAEEEVDPYQAELVVRAEEVTHFRGQVGVEGAVVYGV